MRIKKLQLRNGYKRFHDLTIDLGENPKRIVALIDPNGCGKSSVLDGMLFHNNTFGTIGNKGIKDYTFHSMIQAPNYDYQNVHIDFIEGNFQTVWQQKNKEGKDRTIFTFRSPYRYNSNLKVTRSQALQELRLNGYGATTTIDLDDKMEENYRRLQVKYNNYLHETDCRPSDAKAKIIGDLNNAISSCLDLQIDNLGNIEANHGTIYFSKVDHPKTFEFNVLSSGEKEVIDILLDIYLRREEYNQSIYLIDEPELHINTAIQKKLLLEINKLVPHDCQIWIATHSIGFLRALQEELNTESQIIEFKNGLKWASETFIVEPITKNRANWKRIFSTALDDLTNLISPKRIIYCEGKDKPGANGREDGFDAKVYNNIFSEKYLDTLFVSSGGNTELDQRSEIALAILSKVFTEIEILVLKDRDMSSGKLNTENDRQLYLQNNPENHRVLKRWEIENYLYDKEVLKKYCALNGLTFNEAEYDRFVTDIINQNLKDETGRIKNYCSITTSINPERFKLELSKTITDDMQIFSELENVIFSNN